MRSIEIHFVYSTVHFSVGIGHRSVPSGGELHASQVLTIEPGFYLKDKYGIRIENCYETVPVQVASGATNFLGFEVEISELFSAKFKYLLQLRPTANYRWETQNFHSFWQIFAILYNFFGKLKWKPVK